MNIVPFSFLLTEEPEQCYVIETTGNDMCRAGIYDGMYIVIDTHRAPHPGDIILCELHDSGMIVRRYDPPFLISEGFETGCEMIDPQHFRLCGVVLKSLQINDHRNKEHLEP